MVSLCSLIVWSQGGPATLLSTIPIDYWSPEYVLAAPGFLDETFTIAAHDSAVVLLDGALVPQPTMPDRNGPGQT